MFDIKGSVEGVRYMTLKRMIGTLILCLKKNGFRRADWLKRHRVFVEMGEGCFWQPRYIPPESKLIKLHNNVVIASEVLFINHDVLHHVFRTIEPEFEFPTKYGAIEIGNHVFIGSRCTILPNTKIEDNVIIGAGSLVTGRLPQGGVYAGVPAKRIGDFETILKNRESMSRNGISKELWFAQAWNEFDKKHY